MRVGVQRIERQGGGNVHNSLVRVASERKDVGAPFVEIQRKQQTTERKSNHNDTRLEKQKERRKQETKRDATARPVRRLLHRRRSSW
jgi:hypothetical protein